MQTQDAKLQPREKVEHSATKAAAIPIRPIREVPQFASHNEVPLERPFVRGVLDAPRCPPCAATVPHGASHLTHLLWRSHS